MDEYIDIEKDQIPYQFDLEIAGVVYTFQIDYNAMYDYFTVDLSLAGETLAIGEKVVYGVPLFEHMNDTRLPAYPIVPYDLSGTETRVSWDNLGVSVFLYLYFGDGVDG